MSTNKSELAQSLQYNMRQQLAQEMHIMPYTIEYTLKMRALHDRIQDKRATTTTAYGRQWVKKMNALRYRLAYSLVK